MAIVTWAGGTHRITDPGVWTPAAPQAGDLGFVPSGHLIAVDTTVGYAINLFGTATTATFDGLGATVTGGLGGGLEDLGSAPGGYGTAIGTVAFTGSDVNTGLIGAITIEGQALALQTDIGDVTSPNGVVIQQGVLLNSASAEFLFGEGTFNSAITATSPDAALVNDGLIETVTGLAIDTAIEGSGTISAIQDGRASSNIVFTKAVANSQNVSVFGGAITLDDPLEFGATITTLTSVVGVGAIYIPKTVTSASYDGKTLFLLDGNSLVGAIHFASMAASDFYIRSDGGNTTIGNLSGNFNSFYPSNVAVAAAGPFPTAPAIALPAPVVTLPDAGPNLTFTSGAEVAANQTVDGYTIRLEGLSAAAAPSVNETASTFGSGFALRVNGQAAQARYGSLFAVGDNENDGTVATAKGSAGGAATLALDISDVTSSIGTTLVTGDFANKGVIRAGAGTTISIAGSPDGILDNEGRIVANGTLTIGAAVAGTGTLAVGGKAAAGSLEIGASISTGQTIALDNGGLTIDDLAGFQAGIAGFNGRDSITLKNVTAASATYSDGVLHLDDGNADALRIQGPRGSSLSTGSFVLTQSGSDTVITTAATAGTTVLGSGPDRINLEISEQAYQGDAQFLVLVDGQTIGGVQTATASHAAGQDQRYVVRGDFGPGQHVLEIDYLNDLYYGTADTDRNLFVDRLSAGGVSNHISTPLFSAGPAYFLVTPEANAVACYCQGTLIETAQGERSVETLAIGDVVVTASGERRPIRWIGRRSYAGPFLAANPGLQPVRVSAGALGKGLPRRDLLVSPSHAMVLDGLLVPARCLANGVTIAQERGLARLDYYHVELDSHDVLLAEGAPSESFLDDDSRGLFHNAAEWEAAHPGQPRAPAAYCAPRVESGFALEAIRRRLADVAGGIQQAA